MPGTPSEREKRFAPALLCMPLGIFAAFCLRHAIFFYCGIYYEQFLQIFPELAKLFRPSELPVLWTAFGVVGIILSTAMLAASLAGLARNNVCLKLLRTGYTAAYILFFSYCYLVFSITGVVETSGLETAGGIDIHAVQIFLWRWEYLRLPLCGALFIALLHLVSWRRSIINIYTAETAYTPATGDEILENIRTHGRDPAFRKSSLSSILSHLLVIVIIPWLLEMGGCVEPYRPPFGGGNPVVHMVKVVKKKKKKKKFILNPNSAIIFKSPDLDDSKILEEVEEESRVTYVADPNAAHGKIGDGKGGTPGWQDGFKDGIVRFIRLEYNGPDWDDGMDDITNADGNFLQKFRELSGGIKTARDSESHPIRLLKKYPKGQAPPFVYITGSGSIRASQSDVRILRDYLLGGSMLFADAGSRHWDRSFRHLMSQVFPGNELRVISDDDPIFQIPFTFANGAPPLWHHGGKKAMGIKVKNRWVVFYHPGDINDAWKTGHSGIDRKLADRAYQTGVNVVYYSFMRYFEATKKYRK